MKEIERGLGETNKKNERIEDQKRREQNWIVRGIV